MIVMIASPMAVPISIEMFAHQSPTFIMSAQMNDELTSCRIENSSSQSLFIGGGNS
jgi:hypothetical protein